MVRTETPGAYNLIQLGFVWFDRVHVELAAHRAAACVRAADQQQHGAPGPGNPQCPHSNLEAHYRKGWQLERQGHATRA